MSLVRCVYPDAVPNFPATDQHPQAARYTVRSLFLGRDVTVDAVGGAPTSAEVDAVLNPPAARIESVKSRLREIDAASVRAIREYIVTKADAPQILKDREVEAAAERKNLL